MERGAKEGMEDRHSLLKRRTEQDYHTSDRTAQHGRCGQTRFMAKAPSQYENIPRRHACPQPFALVMEIEGAARRRTP
eukprot:2217353-Pleurochrysis_carterae.AAC.1